MSNETDALRVATAADAEAIHALVQAAYAKWVPVIGRLPMPMQVDYGAAVLRHRFDLLHVGETLAALVETISGHDHLTIQNLAVSPSFQGRGFGVRLLRHAEDLARAAGITQMRLCTNRHYTENLRLYAARGYAATREEPYDGPGKTRADDIVVHMAKPLR